MNSDLKTFEALLVDRLAWLQAAIIRGDQVNAEQYVDQLLLEARLYISERERTRENAKIRRILRPPKRRKRR